MKYSSRFFLYAPFGLFLAVALGVSIYWWLAASALSARLAAMNGREIAPGVTVHYASRTISGFPFTFDTVFHDVTFDIATPHGPARWSAEELAVHALSYSRDKAIFEAAGKQELRWTRDNGAMRTLAFAVGSLHASAIRNDKGLVRFDLDLVGFGSHALTAQRLQFHLRRNGARNTLDIVVEADDVRFSRADSPDLGDQIASAHLAGAISGANAFDGLRAQTWFAAVERWRTAGGWLRVEACSLLWSGLSIDGKGVLTLDNEHRPYGALGVEIAGISRFLQRAKHLPRGPGLAGALLVRRASALGHLNAVLGFDDGIVTLGGEPVELLDPLY